MLNILVIEDVFDEMEYCCSCIRKTLRDCRIFKTGSAERAFPIMAENMIDVFFIDIGLPGMSGLQLAERIHQHENYRLALIVFVSKAQPDLAELHRKFHFYEFVKKPYAFHEFKEAVGAMLTDLDFLKKRDRIIRSGTAEKNLAVEIEKEMIFLRPREILFVEICGRRLAVTTESRRYDGVRNIKLDEFCEAAGDDCFCRCHKSFAVNTARVLSIRNVSRRLWYAYFSDDETLYCPISETYFDTVKNLLMIQ